MGRATREPAFYTIYGDNWERAYARAARLPGRLRRIHIGAMDYVEEGWVPIRALQLAAEDTSLTGPHPSTLRVQAVTFMTVEVTDEFRRGAFGCRDAVPGAPVSWARHRCKDVGGHMEYVQRLLHVLSMGTCHPDFPPLMRDLMAETVAQFDEWVKGISRVSLQLQGEYLREKVGRPPLSFTRGRLRGHRACRFRSASDGRK